MIQQISVQMLTNREALKSKVTNKDLISLNFNKFNVPCIE